MSPKVSLLAVASVCFSILMLLTQCGIVPKELSAHEARSIKGAGWWEQCLVGDKCKCAIPVGVGGPCEPCVVGAGCNRCSENATLQWACGGSSWTWCTPQPTPCGTWCKNADCVVLGGMDFCVIPAAPIWGGACGGTNCSH